MGNACNSINKWKKESEAIDTKSFTSEKRKQRAFCPQH